jgi:hypothetical protein
MYASETRPPWQLCHVSSLLRRSAKSHIKVVLVPGGFYLHRAHARVEDDAIGVVGHRISALYRRPYIPGHHPVQRITHNVYRPDRIGPRPLTAVPGMAPPTTQDGRERPARQIVFRPPGKHAQPAQFDQPAECLYGREHRCMVSIGA